MEGLNIMSRILKGDIKIQYDERANYRICVGNVAGPWVPYTHIATLENMVAFSGYFQDELVGRVFVLHDGIVTVEKEIKL